MSNRGVICFSGWEIRALAAGHKTWFTRRISTQSTRQHLWYADTLGPAGPFVAVFTDTPAQGEKRAVPSIYCPRRIGEVALVGEVHAIHHDPEHNAAVIYYRATRDTRTIAAKPGLVLPPNRSVQHGGWRHPAKINNWTARWTIKIVEIKVQQLRDMSDLDVLDEGFAGHKSQEVSGRIKEADKPERWGAFLDGCPRDGFFLDRRDRSDRNEHWDWMWRYRFEIVKGPNEPNS